MTTETRAISNTDDVIDSRDVIDRIEELRGERDILQEHRDNVRLDDSAETYNNAVADLKDWHDNHDDELTALIALAVEASDYAADWEYGETLIRDTYFQEYAEQLADDIGAIDNNARWPMSHIDWESAARELQMDYTQVDFDGVAYWIR